MDSSTPIMGADLALPADLVAEAVAWRHHLHKHPELAYCEQQTAEFVASQLGQFGLSVHRGLAGTGVVGTISRGTSRRAIGIRADMDALRIQEQSGVPHASGSPGVMHACGHDGHTAIALAAARACVRLGALDGTVHFIFQPAEEGRAGARRMIEDGLFQLFPCDAIYALHNWPDLPVGTMAARSGAMMAASDKFEIVIECHGGHAALPHHTPDAILAASHLISQLNTLVSRRIPATDSAVLSVTQIHGGHAHNALPQSVVITGTVRSFDSGVQDTIESVLRQTAEGVAVGSGTTVKVLYDRYYPATVNDADAAKFVREVSSSPPVHLTPVDADPSMGAEDFAFMLREVPGCYVWLGAGRPGKNSVLHSPSFDFNDELIPLGAQLWISLVRQSLGC